MNPTPWTWKEEVELSEELLERLERNFEIALFEAALGAQEPAHGKAREAAPRSAAADTVPAAEGVPADERLELLIQLAELYCKKGLLHKSLEIDQRLVEARPKEPKFHYNLACSHSLLGNIGLGLEALARALQLGYDKLEQLTRDPDLENLKKDTRYRELLGKWSQGSRRDEERQPESDVGPKGTQLQE